MLTVLRTSLLRRRLGPAVVVVSGLPRSGTSMMMNMLQSGGVPIATDHERTADEDNPKGYFELEAVKELEKSEERGWVRRHRGEALKVISFLLKDLPDDCFYNILFMRRNLREVIASQNKMLRRRGEPVDEANDTRMIQLYTQHLVKVRFMLRRRLNMVPLELDYRAVLDEPVEQARRIAGFLRLDLDPQRMAQAVDPNLYRNRRPARGIAGADTKRSSG